MQKHNPLNVSCNLCDDSRLAFASRACITAHTPDPVGGNLAACDVCSVSAGISDMRLPQYGPCSQHIKDVRLALTVPLLACLQSETLAYKVIMLPDWSTSHR